MTPSEAIVIELMRDPVLAKSLLVCAELSTGEDVSEAESMLVRRHLDATNFGLCPHCYRATLYWPDGIQSNWPERTLHKCPGMAPSQPAAGEFA